MKTNAHKAKTLALSLSALSALSATGCGDDDSGAPPGGGAPAGPLYAIMYEVYDDTGSTSYLSLLDSLDVPQIDAARAREYGGGRAFLQAYNGWVFVGAAASPTVTRYEVSQAGDLVEAGTVSFANYGLEAGNLDNWNVSFISPTKAYLLDFKEGITIIFNPTTMEITGDIAPPPGILREGLSLEGSPAALRGNLLFRTFNWVNYDTAEYSTDTLLAVYDVEQDAIVDTATEARCPAPGNLVHRDEAGAIYFSNWIWPVAGTLMRGAPESCVLRINPGEGRFDPAWALRYGDMAEGRQGAMFTYLAGGKGLFSAFYNERIAFDATTDPWEYAGSPNWRIWGFDMNTNAAAPVEGIDFNSGAYTPAQFDGRVFLMVPNDGWSSTQLYEVKDGAATPAVAVPGWTYQFVKVR